MQRDNIIMCEFTNEVPSWIKWKIYFPSPQWNGNLLLSARISWKYSILHQHTFSGEDWLTFWIHSLQKSCLSADWMDHFENIKRRTWRITWKNYSWHYNICLDTKVLMVVFAANILLWVLLFFIKDALCSWLQVILL